MDEMLDAAVLLGEHGFATFSVSLRWNHAKAGKEIHFPFAEWNKAGPATPDHHPLVSDRYNGLAIVTGRASDVLVIDADRAKPGEACADGVEVMERLAGQQGLPESTLVAHSGSGGRHYLFSYSKTLAAGLRADVAGRAKLELGGVRASVDSRVNNNCLVVAPTAYETPAGRREYMWEGGLRHSGSLPAAPQWLVAELNRTKTKREPNGREVRPAKLARLDTAFDACEPLLRKVGFTQLAVTRVKRDGFDFVADRGCGCPLCNLHHDTNEWYSIRLCEGCFEVKSYSARCQTRVLGLETQRQLQNIFTTPCCDEVYVDIFTGHFGLGKTDRPVIWTGRRWLEFQGHLWRPVEADRVRGLLVSMCVLLLDRLARHFKALEVEADLSGGSKQGSAVYKAVIRGVTYIKRAGNQRNIIDCLRTSLFLNVGEDPSGIRGAVCLDDDPHLLGANNGVLDLRTGLFRAGRPDDWLSKSVGYDYLPTPDGQRFIERTMEQTFPVAEERGFVQRYAGYCLLGNHPQKAYMVLTDMPGKRSGNNGKTTISQGLRHALGPEYACQGIAASLYADASSRDENSCTPGRLHYRGMRLATFEELDDKRKLDTTRLKNLHGGCATETGRDAYGKSVQSFEWTTKFLITFNISNLPDLDFSDHVHLRRMLVVRCRSKFVPQAELSPDTFLEIPDFGALLHQHASDMLAWAAAGLQAYFASGLADPPAIMDTWKRELTCTQDLVKDWVADTLVPSEQQFVKRSDLYQHYRAATEEERQPRKALGKQKFFHKLLLELGEDNYKARHAGARDCFLNWSYINSSPSS